MTKRIGSVSWDRKLAAESNNPPSPIGGDERSKSVCASCGKIMELPLQNRDRVIPKFVRRNDPEILRCRTCAGEDIAAFRAGAVRNRTQRMRARLHLWRSDRR